MVDVEVAPVLHPVVQGKRRALRPSAPRLAGLGALCALATLFFHSGSVFAFGSHRPAGYTVLVEDLPRGKVCRAAYGDKDPERPEWNPKIEWSGQLTWRPDDPEIQKDKYKMWYHFDADNVILRDLADRVAEKLMGRDNPLRFGAKGFWDVGAFAIVTNCEKVMVTGQKYWNKLYFTRHVDKPGAMRVERFFQLIKRFPERVVMRAVWGRMPHDLKTRQLFRDRLKLFKGPNHLYYDQNPIKYPSHFLNIAYFEQSLTKRWRYKEYMLWRKPFLEAIQEKRIATEKDRKLTFFKSFLREQYEKESPEDLEKMSVQDLVDKAEKGRYEKKLKDSMGLPENKTPKPVYLGTNIPKKKVWHSNM